MVKKQYAAGVKIQKKILTAVFTLLLTGSGFLSGLSGFEPIEGSEIIHTGLSAQAIGIGGAYAAADDDIGYISVNPAAAGGILRPNINLTFLGFGNLSAYSLFAGIPTPFGVIIGGYDGIYSEVNALGSMHHFQLGFAKEISLQYSAAFCVNVDRISDHTSAYSGLGVAVDAVVTKNIVQELPGPVGLGNRTWALWIKNFGVPAYFKDYSAGENQYLKAPEIRAGAKLDWLRIPVQSMHITSRLYGDIALSIPVYFNLKVNFGLDTRLMLQNKAVEYISLKIGILPTFVEKLGTPGLGPVSGGLGAKFTPGTFDILFNYALIPYNRESLTGSENLSGIYHTFSLGTSFGFKDVSKPAIDLGELQGDDLILEYTE